MTRPATIPALPCRIACPRAGTGCSTAKLSRSASGRCAAMQAPEQPIRAAVEQLSDRQPLPPAAEPVVQTLALEPGISLNLWQRYCLSLETNPISTKAATSLVGFCLGDLLAQSLAVGVAFDAARLARLGAYGLLLDGPGGHMWYKWLDGTVDKTCHKKPNGAKAVGLKTAADQLVWSPIMTVVFFAFLKLLEGQPDMVWATVAEKTLPTVAASYVIWPAALIFSFKYVPSQQRVLFNNSIAIFWNCFLSLTAAHVASGTDAAGPDLDIPHTLRELYQNAELAAGVLPHDPAATVAASDLGQSFCANLQSSAAVHSPEVASGLATVPTAPVWLQNILKESAHAAAHTRDTIMSVCDSLSPLHHSMS